MTDEPIVSPTTDSSTSDELPSRRRHSRRTVVLATTAAASTVLAFGGWGVAGALGSTATSLPVATTASRATTIDASSVASRVDASVVDIVANDGYTGETDAGTGMILTSNGEVLTNNHVVKEATSITVRLVSTGKTYHATVVGTDATDDVAVLKLSGASGLTPIHVASTPTVGTAVAAIGNAYGQSGTPAVATGTITAVGRSITVSDDAGGEESLSNLLETDAGVVSGDSGGPLVDAAGNVVGMDTAAEEDQQPGFANVAQTTGDGYAIPISRALSIAKQILAGHSSSTIVIGTPGFLGIEVSDASAGQPYESFGEEPFGSEQQSTDRVIVMGVADNGPAAAIGLTAGDVISGVDGTTITSADQLTSLLAHTHAGSRISVTWTDSAGSTHTATATLIAGPAA